MQIKIVDITKNHMIFSVNNPIAVGTSIDFRINLPEGSSIEFLQLSGTVMKCLKSDMGDNTYLLELSLAELTDSEKLIFNAYLTYLEREQLIDSFCSNTDYESAIKIALTSGNDVLKYSSLVEYIQATIKGEPFN